MYGGICFGLRVVVLAIFFIFPCDQGRRRKIPVGMKMYRVLFYKKIFLVDRFGRRVETISPGYTLALLSGVVESDYECCWLQIYEVENSTRV